MYEMDLKKLDEMIKLAMQAVQGMTEPWASVAFGVILSRLMDSEKTPSNHNVINQNMKSHSNSNDMEHKKEELAKKCNITKLELEEVISIRNNSIEVIFPVQGNEKQKHIIGSQIVLIASESLLDLDWIPSTIITECLRGMGVTDLANVSISLRKHPEIFRSQGTRGHSEYKLTSNIGRQSAYELIRKLVKGEKLNEN